METARVCPKHKGALGKYSSLEMQNQRERDKQPAEQRILHEKERITTEIIGHGLWLTAADVDFKIIKV